MNVSRIISNMRVDETKGFSEEYTEDAYKAIQGELHTGRTFEVKRYYGLNSTKTIWVTRIERKY